MATQFHQILNEQEPHISYTMEIEDNNKSIQFLDLNIVNNGDSRYEYKIHRKNAITNVQIKPHSGHDPKVLKGIFTCFLHRTYTVCEGHHLEDEINFLITCFSENGYKNQQLKQIAETFKQKWHNTDHSQQNQLNTNIVTLPWVPVLCPKLRKIFENKTSKQFSKVQET